MVRWTAVLLAALVVTSCSGVSADEHEPTLEELRRAEQATASLEQEFNEQAGAVEQLRLQIEALEGELVEAADQT